MIDFGMNVQQAGDVARFSHAGSSEPSGTLMTTGGLLARESGRDVCCDQKSKRKSPM